jgi:hypothetical protein
MYIRTKDGVYKIDEVKPYFLDEKQKLFINNELKVAINEQRVIKQSENLEELCDEFVFEYLTSEEVNQIRYPEFQWAKEDFESHKKGTLYGAIRVAGKGLIYVAKMNENGELELI